MCRIPPAGEFHAIRFSGWGWGGGKGRIPLLSPVQHISDAGIQHFREITEGRDENSAEHIKPKDIEKRPVHRL